MSGGFENVEKLGHLFHPKDIIDVAAGIGKAIEVKGEAVIGGLTRWTGPEGENVGHGFILSNEVLPALSSTYDPDEKAPVASPWTAWPISGADPEEKAPVAAPLATVGAEPEEKASTASPVIMAVVEGAEPDEKAQTASPVTMAEAVGAEPDEKAPTASPRNVVRLARGGRARREEASQVAVKSGRTRW